MNQLTERIIQIAKKYNLSHIGSAISAIGILDHIYKTKEKHERFYLGNSHAFLALAVILETYEGQNAEDLVVSNGTHAHRNLNDGIYCSGGSLGMVESIALGDAMTSKDNVYLLSSDGGMMNEIPWGVLRVKCDNNVNNLKWFINGNGFGALDKIDVDKLEKRIYAFCPDVNVIRTRFHGYDFLNGIDAHYVTIK